MSNLPKILTVIALSVMAVFAAGYYALTGAPGPDGKITLATGGVGHYHELGLAYQKALAPYGVEVVLQPGVEGFRTLRGLVAEPPEFDAAFVKGGLVGSMQGRLARAKAQEWQSKELGKLRAAGRLFYEPIWVFVRSDFTGNTLADLKAKKILMGARGSGTRFIAGQLLRANGVDTSRDNPLLIMGDLSPDAAELVSGEAEAAILVQPADSELIQKLLRLPSIRLMDFSLEADAYVNRFPSLSKVRLDRGAVEFEPLIPAKDITLLATSAVLVVRADLPPSLVSLLTHAALHNPRAPFDKSGDPVLFHKPGLFPHLSDPEYQVMEASRQVYKSGDLPVALRTAAPAVKEAGFPYKLTAFISDHGAATVLFVIPSLVILLPLLRFMPSLYSWTVRRRLMYWYRQLKTLERRLDKSPSTVQRADYLAEIERIDSGVRRIRYPLYFSDQFYHLRLHIDLVRQRLTEMPEAPAPRMAAE